MYFRNKFDEEFLFLANEITPKGGSVRLDAQYPNYFVIERPAFDEAGMYIVVKPALLYNKITSTNPNDINVEDYIMLCENKKDTIITCSYDKYHPSEQGDEYDCNLNFININGDLIEDEEDWVQYYNGVDYDYEDV